MKMGWAGDDLQRSALSEFKIPLLGAFLDSIYLPIYPQLMWPHMHRSNAAPSGIRSSYISPRSAPET